MFHRGADLVRRGLDWVERLLWQRQDDALAAAGWQVVRVGRWQRRYRHPALLRAATAHGARQRQRRAAERVS
jgi:hypothetical protein